MTILTNPNCYTEYINYVENIESFDDNLEYFMNKYYAIQASELLAKDAYSVSKWLK